MSLHVSIPARRAALPGVARGILLAIALFALLAAVPLAHAAPPSGVDKSFFGVSGRHLDNRDFEDLETAGVGTYRSLINFRLIKRQPHGPYDWDQLDRLIGRMASRDIKVLPLLYGTPSWIHRRKTVPPIYSEGARKAWSQLLAALVGRYGPRGTFWRFNPLIPYRPVTAWQVWNEPNSAPFWAPGPSPGEYARLLRLSAAAIHRVDPSATIVSAGLVANPQSIGSIPGDEYLARLAASPVIRRDVDVYGYHPYARNARAVRAELSEARRALRTQGEGTAPIWVTEVGWGSDSIIDRLMIKSRQGQAQVLARTYATVLARRGRLGIGRMLWYYWRDQADPLCIWCRSAGLLDRSHKRKPAFVAFRRLTGS